MADYFGSTLTDLQSAKTAQLAIEEETRRQAAAQLFQMMNAVANRNEARRTGDLDRNLRGRTLDEEMAYRGRELGLRGRVADNEYDLGGRRVGIDQGRNEIEEWKNRQAALTAAERLKAEERIQQGINEATVKAAEATANGRNMFMDPRVTTAFSREQSDIEAANFDAEVAAEQLNSQLKPHLDELQRVYQNNPTGAPIGWFSTPEKAEKKLQAAADLLLNSKQFMGQPILFDPRSRRFVARKRPVPNYFGTPEYGPQLPTVSPNRFFPQGQGALPAGRTWRRVGPPAQ